MGSYGTIDEAGGSEGTIEIKIKTLDSRSYSLRVNKQMPVPALKEQIASLTGVLTEQQRLICRGKVLKDDQLLSAYHVEDGHTLHLVVRQPSDGSHSYAADPSTVSQGNSSRVGPRVVIETLNIPDQGEGLPPEISQIVSAVLGSFGLSGAGISREGGNERISSATNISRMQSEDSSLRGHSGGLAGAFGIPAATSQPPVIPDSLTTMSRFLNLMTSEFANIGRGSENLEEVSQRSGLGDAPPSTHSGTVQAGLPTPESLANILSSTRQFLIQQVAGYLQAFANQLENQGSITDSSVRLNSQHSAIRMGAVLHHLGAFILELGRTVMTLRLGTSTAEAVVNAGPAVFISPTGPNPLMVQPLSFQTGSSLGGIQVANWPSGSSWGSSYGSGFHPRRIDIQIRRASNGGSDRAENQPPSAQANPSENSGGENNADSSASINPGTEEAGVRAMPFRTMVAAVPPSFNQVGSDSRGHPLGIYYPVVGRLQPVASSENVFSERPTHTSYEQHLAGGGSGQTSVSNSIPQQHNTVENPERDGSPTEARNWEPTSRGVNINIVSSSTARHNQQTVREISGSVVEFLQTLFPGGDVNNEEASINGVPVGEPRQDAGIASAEPSVSEVGTGASDDGILLSNLLRQIMPYISQHALSGSSNAENVTRGRVEEDSSSLPNAEETEAGTSRRHRNSDSAASSTKRQKTD
ncbi:hypothetical protein MLD38_006789 [Melastoma candidum]|uniref:Uncharacterized protein n=1 Tax=Melastoma candidum TaxID=119954 RepID=A0ACB9RP53_9MYRT|nr:hypothetical protein MLD38_006789 [Melastoma candidum]